MHVLRTHRLFFTPYPWHHPYCCCCRYSSTPVPKPPPPAAAVRRRHLPWSLGRSLVGAVATPLSSSTAAGCAKGFRSQEFPIGPDDESYLEKYRPKDKETEDEARRRNWIDRDWAPWEEILTPEGDFARKSLNEGEEVPLQTPEALEAFRMLTPKYRKKKMAELGLTEDEFYAKQFDIKGEILEPLQTTWDCPLVVCNLPPRDWPPRGWSVPPEELRFIREAHRSHNLRRVSFQDIANATDNADGLCEDRYNMFLKQYNEWVLHNKDRLEQESYKYDQDYHPGRRKRGKDYKEGMYELPFYYPGQLCVGKVTTLHLYQGAFVDIGGVYEGWVPIKGNDWYWIRQHIKVGMIVMVEILAKRDPYRFRFPIEMRFVDPNIDHLIFRRFEYPPIFHHQADTNPDELRRDCGRPPIPRKDPKIKVEDEGLKSNHPYVDRLWQLHNAEQLILDDMEENPQKYEGKKITELTDDEEINEENCVEYTKVHLRKGRRKGEIRKMILRTSVKDLDLEAALAERELNNKLNRVAGERGEEHIVTKLRRNIEMDEYDFIHWRRSYEEREALLRDISCRQALGLPLMEPGRYVDASILGKGEYDPTDPLYRYDYWGEPKNSEKSIQDSNEEAEYNSIMGKGTVYSEMSYEDAIKEKMRREAGEREARAKARQKKEAGEVEDADGQDDDDYDDNDIDFRKLSENSVDVPNDIVVNGTESPSMSDASMFDN